jgi:NAD-reducing hydrogenase small subunit
MTNAKIRLATVWLAGCSGCHMSFLDLDEWLLELAERAEIVYSPVASDIKTFPSDVDVCLVEGGVANTDNLELLHQVRANSRVLVSFGDCAITANIPGMRNMLNGADPVLRRSYLELADGSGQLPHAPGIPSPLPLPAQAGGLGGEQTRRVVSGGQVGQVWGTPRPWVWPMHGYNRPLYRVHEALSPWV